jgi:hypothetical protein
MHHIHGVRMVSELTLFGVNLLTPSWWCRPMEFYRVYTRHQDGNAHVILLFPLITTEWRDMKTMTRRIITHNEPL